LEELFYAIRYSISVPPKENVSAEKLVSWDNGLLLISDVFAIKDVETKLEMKFYVVDPDYVVYINLAKFDFDDVRKEIILEAEKKAKQMWYSSPIRDVSHAALKNGWEISGTSKTIYLKKDIEIEAQVEGEEFYLRGSRITKEGLISILSDEKERKRLFYF